MNFASAAAQLRRTLLINMDPTRKHSIGPRDSERTRGVFDILAGLCLAREAIQTIPKTRLDYIAAGRDYGPDTLPLVAGDRLRQLLGEIRPSYDWIVILGSPIVGGNETRLIAGTVDRAILVTRAGVSTFPDVAAAVHDLSCSMALETYSNGSAPISSVLTDAPRRSLPVSFRDRRFVKSKGAPLDMPTRLAQAPGVKNEEPAPRWGWKGAVSRFVTSRGS